MNRAKRTALALQDLQVGNNDIPLVSSRALADRFGKEHYNLIRQIQALDIPEDFAALNFEAGSYLDQNGARRPEYMLTQDGATLLVMGWTGSEAMAWKVAYIQAFARMRGYVHEMCLDDLPPVVRMALKPEPSEWSSVWDSVTTKSICRLYGLKMDGAKQPRGLSSIYAKLYKAMLTPEVYAEVKRRNPNPAKGSNHHQHLNSQLKDEVIRAHLFTRYAADSCGRNIEAFWDMITDYHSRTRQLMMFAHEREGTKELDNA